MDFLEHDLKTLLEDMREPFLPSEIKTLLLQIISATEFLHSHWILHRDLKTSNLLMNNRGEIKIADFGMARYYGDPPPKLTQLVVTLWYRSPELFLGAEKYGPEIDIWSIGCIFGELLTNEPLFQGKNEVDQLSKVSPPWTELFYTITGTDPRFPRYSPSPALQHNRHGHPSAPCLMQSPFAYHQGHHPHRHLPLRHHHSSPGRNFPTSPTPASPCSPLSWR